MRGHLFERRRVKHIVHPAHGGGYAARFTHIADVKLELGMVVALAHVVLFFLVTAEDADFTQVRIQKTPQHGVAEGAGATGD